MELIDKLAWIHINDRKVLFVRSKGKKTWYFPGGKREKGESDEEVLVREISEELTVDLVPDSIEYLETFSGQADGKPKGVLVQSACYTANYEGELSVSSEIEEMDWFTSEVDPNKLSNTGKKLIKYLKDKDLID